MAVLAAFNPENDIIWRENCREAAKVLKNLSDFLETKQNFGITEKTFVKLIKFLLNWAIFTQNWTSNMEKSQTEFICV